MDRSAADKCPLCESPNRCAIAAGMSAESCWCQSSAITPEALAALPADETGRRCICPACAGASKGDAE